VSSLRSRATINVEPADKWVSLNWIGAATFRTPQPSIDEHDMWVYEVDGTYIKPVKVQALNLWVGERFSVMVRLDKTPGTYTIRVPDFGATQVIAGYADLVYKGAARRHGPTTPWIRYGGAAVSNATTILAPWSSCKIISNCFLRFGQQRGQRTEKSFFRWVGRTRRTTIPSLVKPCTLWTGILRIRFCITQTAQMLSTKTWSSARRITRGWT